MKGLGKGKVYSFYSQPHVQIVTLQSDEKISAGSFTLKLTNHQGVEEGISRHIACDSTPDLFKLALEEVVAVGEVNIEVKEKIEQNSYEMKWRISFLSSFADNPPILIPQWHGNGCFLDVSSPLSDDFGVSGGMRIDYRIDYGVYFRSLGGF